MVFLYVGKAYAIFRTKNDADSAISKINSGLVVGGRYAFILDAIYFVFSASMSYPVTDFSSSGENVVCLFQLLKSHGKSTIKIFELEQRVFCGDSNPLSLQSVLLDTLVLCRVVSIIIPSISAC